MKKRIVCVLLTLIMLMSLVPLSASAASYSISESAITVLKQLEGYTTKCTANGITGYGTKCTEEGTHGSHITSEKKADAALRTALKDLDKAVTTFATNNGVTLNQGKHDALVLFSFENGTAWTTGTGDFKAAVTSGATGTEFLSAICQWDASTGDDTHRMVEANMYLYGVYSSARPSQFVHIKLNANGGSMSESENQYYDISTTQTINITPTRKGYKFLGWYTKEDTGYPVSTITAARNGWTLIAHWQANGLKAENATSNADYTMSAGNLASTTIYRMPNGDKTGTYASGTITIDCDYIDANGNKWSRVINTNDDSALGWVLQKDVSGVSSGSGATINVTVTVTNSYVRRREKASIYSTQNGTYYQGEQLRIISTEQADGFLWGQVADSNGKTLGWVALMYTNWETVKDGATGASTSTAVIATATINYPQGYVNVRSDAGTSSTIVGALPHGTTVEIYETKYVNGIQWGRCSTGWICLAYADVEGLDENANISDVGFTSYAFTGTIADPATVIAYSSPSETATPTKEPLTATVTVTKLTSAEGYTWGKVAQGWIRVTDNTTYEAVDVDLDKAKFTTVADVTVREQPSTSAARKNVMVKGVEFNVNEKYQVIVVGETVWAWATKVGEDARTYDGWVNLASKYVTRGDAPEVTPSSDSSVNTGLMATVVNTDSVRVRKTGATYGTQIGSLPRGATVAVWEANSDKTWYKVDSNQNGTYEYDGDGWVYAEYLNIYQASSTSTNSSGTSTTGTSETGMGVVANTYSGVNVRQGPGTNYAIVDKLLPGTAVEILEVKTVGTTKWGRTTYGWVCMDYITMISSTTTTTNNADGSTTTTTTTDSEVAIYTGTIKAGLGSVTVFKETSNKSEAVRTLESGANITMHELLTVDEEIQEYVESDDNTGTTVKTEKKTTYWARVNDGYIEAPADNIELDTLDEVTYTVTGYDTLNVRSTAGVDGSTVVHTLSKGDQVTVTRLQIVKNSVWGYIEADAINETITDEEGNKTEVNWSGEGWVNMSYMTKGAVSVGSSNTTDSNTTADSSTTNNTTTTTTPAATYYSTGNTGAGLYTGKVIRTNSVNVRATASTTAAVTTTLAYGDSMVIYETCISENMAWGRCDAGWVYLYYVDLTPATAGYVDARVVYNDGTIIYADAGCTTEVGSYAKMAVINICEIVGKMARTDLGWVNTDNLL